MHVSSQIPHTRQRLPVLEQRISRRRFTRYLLFGLLGAFTATSAVATYRMLYPNKVTGFGAKIAAGTVSDIKTLLASQKYVRNTEGHFYFLPTTEPDHAIAAYWRCPHLGCTVPPPNPGLEGNIQCPCHGSLYNGLTGQLIHGPATRSLDYFPMTVQNGNVTVNTGKIIMRLDYNPSQATKLG